MRALFAIIVFGLLQTASDAQQATNAQSSVAWKPQALASGIYEPDSKYRWYAGEVIEIDGTNFQYHHFTDVPPPPSDYTNYTGAVVQLKDHIMLDHPKVPNPERISGLLSNLPVLWVWDGYQQWKRWGGNPGPKEVLYLRPTNTYGVEVSGEVDGRSLELTRDIQSELIEASAKLLATCSNVVVEPKNIMDYAKRGPRLSFVFTPPRKFDLGARATGVEVKGIVFRLPVCSGGAWIGSTQFRWYCSKFVTNHCAEIDLLLRSAQAP